MSVREGIHEAAEGEDVLFARHAVPAVVLTVLEQLGRHEAEGPAQLHLASDPRAEAEVQLRDTHTPHRSHFAKENLTLTRAEP